MRDRSHTTRLNTQWAVQFWFRIVFGAVLLLSGGGCNASGVATTAGQALLKKPDGTSLTRAEADAAGSRLAALLPDAVGEFRAGEPATLRVRLEDATIGALRQYVSADRQLIVELMTGNIARERDIILSDEAHAFGSDSYVYWRTVQIKGRRARIGEDKRGVNQSELYLQVGPAVVARVSVSPHAAAGQSGDLIALFDLDAVEKAGVRLNLPETPQRR